MKNVTKANVLFTATVLVYLILVYTIRLIPAGTFSMNFLLIMPEIILLLPSILYMAFMRDDTVSDCGVAKISPLTTFFTVLFAFCIIPLVSFINMISSLFVENGVSETLTRTVESNSLIVNLLVIALLPAVVEEIIFRGLIFNGYKKRNPFKAALLSAFLFGLIHMNINQFSYAFVIGILFALLTYVTGSVIPSIIAHFIVNGTSVVLSHLLVKLQKTDVAVNQATEMIVDENAIRVALFLMMAVMALAGLALAVLLFYGICRKNRGFESFKMILKKPMRNSYDETQGRFFDGFLLLGIGICVLYIVYYEFMI
ncbi:MAG: CPBP family intramembrane metalloprotease [Lachnospiraceae bacterium]|nr:CPBP family intramembrane metalloprotease [Lachnospiraceae bacterium]